MIRRNLNNSPREIEEHLEALEERQKGYGKQFLFHYEALSILDGKASSLLAFNAIGLPGPRVLGWQSGASDRLDRARILLAGPETHWASLGFSDTACRGRSAE